MQTTILKSISYPLLATTLTAKECHTVLKPILAEGLSAVVHGPVKFRGLGIMHLLSEQNLTQIELLLKFSTHPTHLTGQLLWLSVEQLKLEVGVNESILSLPYEVYQPMVTHCLLTSVWSFLSKHGM